MTGNVKGFAKAKRAHPPAALKAKEAQGAALAPTDDLSGQAKAAKADTMDAQQAGTFDKKAFIAAVKTAIEAKSPKTLKEADDYKESGKAGEVKGDVKGMVGQGKEGQAKDIETATAAAPDTSKGVAKPVTPMETEDPGQAAVIPAAGAAPKAAPPEQTNLAAGKHEANQEMAEAEVTDQQLAQSNEPQFQGALADKQTAATHADTAPAAFRAQEQQTIQQNKTEAAAETKTGVAGLQGSKAAALAKLVADKGKTKSKDEAKRAEVTTKIQGIFTAAEADVKTILDGIDPQVDAEFEQGEKKARGVFENYVSAKMSAYKEDRYGGWLGGLRWAKDKLVGMPDKVNEFYEAGRELYLQQMNVVISKVADIVGGELTRAKTRIATGRTEIAAYVKSLPTDLQKVGSEASKEIGEKFADLEGEVDSKQDAMVEALASKYSEARKGLDDRIEELQAENKGLVDKAIGAIKAVINTIRELVGMLKNVLARVAGVVGDIVKNPVGFLSNLIDGVKGGILKFKDNILDHLRKGLMSWLFGALAEGGVQLPDKFDMKGILQLLLSLFGLTWANIRNRLVKNIGEPAMAAMEKGVEIFQKLRSEGIAGLWQMLIEKLGDIKEMILEQVKDFVITKIITAGITWLIGLLNPAAAFIKACKLIYDVVMFFVNNGSRILKFVNTVIDSVADIVKGNVGGVVNKINDVLGQMVPIIIGFLASVIGLGGIGQKIREIVDKLQKPVNKALDSVIKTGLKLAGPVIRGLKNIGGKVKKKVAAGKAYVKGKVEAGKAYVKDKLRGKPTETDSPRSKAVKESAHRQVLERMRAPFKKPEEMKAIAAEILAKLRPQGLQNLFTKPVSGKPGVYSIVAVASPEEPVGTAVVSDVDPAAVRTAIATAHQEKAAAVARHGQEGGGKDVVWASGGGRVFRQGAGEAPEGDAPVTELTPYIAAKMAKFTELGEHHDITAMTTMTPEAQAAVDRLRKHQKTLKTTRGKDNVERKIQKLLRSVTSYEHGAAYAGATQDQRQAESAATGRWLPKRSARDSGVPGYADLVHAEKNVYRVTQAQAIGVSTLPQCGQCVLWFKDQAMSGQRFIVVVSEVTRVFLPNGDIRDESGFQ
ncbi:hypothetical protein F1D05_31070 [Kribbella qitaiheensis]|uniref:Uncharacterized protein n=1 Tax=Kribbella qitaiheensis TaxID=1544730 RepID=A0A7G6X5N8_9ACTN|nr:hypothetical protein F1D05_31070 [Kribbella qitaiheensis]